MKARERLSAIMLPDYPICDIRLVLSTGNYINTGV